MPFITTKFSWVIVVLGLCCPALLNAQLSNVEFTRLGIQKGQFQTTIYSIAQDNTGFMWIASQYGLQIFDGANFTEFRHSAVTNNRINTNSLSQVLVDTNNDIWMGTWGGGLNIYNRSTGKLSVFRHYDKNPKSLSFDKIQTLFKDKQGTIWIGTAGRGLCKFNATDSSFISYPYGEHKPNAITQGRIWAITQAADGLLWVGTEGGVNTVDPTSGVIKKIELEPEEKKSESANLVRALYARKNGDIWVGTQNGIYIFHPGNSRPTQLSLPFNDPKSYKVKTINCFYETADGSMLIGTFGAGLYYIDARTGDIRSYQYSLADNTSLLSNDIRCITTDKSGLIWIGSRSGGINTTQMQPKRFTTINNEIWKQLSLHDKNIRSVFYDSKDNLWIGTNEAGLHLLKKGENTIKAIKRNGVDYFKYSDRVFAIQEDCDGKMWFLCDDGLYSSVNQGATLQKFSFPSNAPLPAKSERMRQFCMLDNRYMWFGTNGFGFLQFDRTSGTWTAYTTKQHFPSDDVNFIVPATSQGILWLGTNNGLVKFNFLTGKFTTYGNEPNNVLWNNPILAMKMQGNIIWLGTSDGFIRFSITSGTLDKPAMGSDFTSKAVSGIIVDNHGTLWLSTLKGITRYNQSEGQSKSYDIEDGLDWNTFNAGVFSVNKSGEVAFGGINGLTIFNPDRISRNMFRSPVAITGFELFNKEGVQELLQPGQSTKQSQEFSLNYTQDNFKITFVTFNYLFSGKNRYFYQLEGADATWRDAGTVNYAIYSQVHPGKYVFRVKALNNDMTEMENEASIIITVQPPYYETTWFRVLLALAIAGLIAGGFYLRLTSLKHMQQQLELEVEKRTAELKESENSLREANATKDKFFSIIAHDLRSPFQTLISYSNIINTEFDSLPENERKSLAGTIEHVALSTYELLENLLKWSFTQTKILEIKPVKVNLEDAVTKILRINSQAASMKDIAVGSDIPADINLLADKDMLETIFRNIVGNAIKFTKQGGTVQITAGKNDNHAVITIKDSGVGMSPEKVNTLFSLDQNKSTAGTNHEKGSGLGLILCKELVDLHKGKLYVQSQPDLGTAFIIELPLFSV